MINNDLQRQISDEKMGKVVVLGDGKSYDDDDYWTREIIKLGGW